MKRKLQEQCDHIEKLLTDAGYKVVRAEPFDVGYQLGVLVRIDNADVREQFPWKKP